MLILYLPCVVTCKVPAMRKRWRPSKEASSLSRLQRRRETCSAVSALLAACRSNLKVCLRELLLFIGPCLGPGTTYLLTIA